MKKGRFGIGPKSLAFVVAALGFIGGQSASAFIPANNSASVRIKDAVKDHVGQYTQSESRKGFSGQSPFLYYRKFERNQRQYRNSGIQKSADYETEYWKYAYCFNAR